MQEFVPIKQIVSETMGQIEEIRKTQQKITGLRTGFIDLDWVTTGFHKGDFILLAGRPSMGCTSLMLQIANHMASCENKKVLYFHLELTKEMMAKRLLAQDSEVDLNYLLRGKLKEHEWEKVKRSADIIKQSHLIIDDTPLLSIEELKEKCREYQAEQVDLIIIDYIQLLQGTQHNEQVGRKRELEEVVRGIQELAVELNVPIVAVSRLSRRVERRRNHRPTVRDLDIKASLLREADIVLLLYRDSYYHFHSKARDIAEIIVARNRYGTPGIIELNCIRKSMKYQNYER